MILVYLLNWAKWLNKRRLTSTWLSDLRLKFLIYLEMKFRGVKQEREKTQQI